MQYVTRAFLSVDGKAVADFSAVKESEVELRMQVPLMHKTGFARKTPRYGLEVTYQVPEGPEFDWETLEEGTLIIEHENGARTLYTGVSTLRVGERNRDGETAMQQVITLGATGRTKE